MNSPLHGLAQAACNRALALDPECERILDPLCGRRICVQVKGMPALDLDVHFGHDSVAITAPAGDGADASVCGTPAALLSMASGDGGLPATDGVEVRGDMGVLQALGDAMSRLRPDWHEPLARVFGDELGHPLARGLEHAFALVRRTARELHADTAEFLREESGLLVMADEVDAFGDEVDRLRDAVERLDKRIARLPRRS